MQYILKPTIVCYEFIVPKMLKDAQLLYLGLLLPDFKLWFHMVFI